MRIPVFFFFLLLPELPRVGIVSPSSEGLESRRADISADIVCMKVFVEAARVRPISLHSGNPAIVKRSLAMDLIGDRGVA